MSEVTIAVDANGGDNAPDIVLEGSLDALRENKDINIVFFGNKEDIVKRLRKLGADTNRIKVVDAKEKIENTDAPVIAIRRKKDSAIVKGLKYVKEGNADAFVSAGNTGAILAGGTLLVGRIKGIERPALASLIPTSKGFSLLMDVGANVDCKPQFLHQFAKMGIIYYNGVMGTNNATVGLVNNGEESKKGNILTKETYKVLDEDKDINFIGNVEARYISSGKANVIVCDGFVGNVILKHTEGVAKMILGLLKETLTSTWYTKIGALLIKKQLKKSAQSLDYTEYGGAPLLGLNGLVVKAHGSSNAKAFKNAILQCKKFSDEQIKEKIIEQIHFD